MKVVTRFAPSPTGYLHIGGARTALFNYLFAKHYNGKFLLRIEDTDRARSTNEAVEAIFKGLEWLDITWDSEPVFQYARRDMHREVALKLVAENKAYYCFSSPEEIEEFKNSYVSSKNENRNNFKSPWRDANPASFPVGIKPVIRLKSLLEGETIIDDKLQGKIKIKNEVLDDMVLLRNDGSATYMLAVVVDDHDMGITHIIRGDDHLTNAARQLLLYKALDWQPPIMVHIPLIHGSDGAKLSKRHGALGIEAYKDIGLLPEALCNYLLRLGWAHGDEEIISRLQAIEWFDLKGLGKSPAKLDFDKMKNVNSYYIKNKEDQEFVAIILENINKAGDIIAKGNITKAIATLKNKFKLTTEIFKIAYFYLPDVEISYSEQTIEMINNFAQAIKINLLNSLINIEVFNKENIQLILKQLATQMQIDFSKLMLFLRLVLTGESEFTNIIELMEIIGDKEVIKRYNKIVF